MSDAWVVLERIDVAAPTSAVWQALTSPEALARWYFPGIAIRSTYAVGDPITWSFTLDGEARRDHGTILEHVAGRRLVYDHWSSLSGRPDAPEGRTVTAIDLEAREEASVVTVRQTGFARDVEFFHARSFWRIALVTLRRTLEGAA
ncbi:MAG: SRPBCC domain-containing protein [Nannocystaceae bacterium]